MTNALGLFMMVVIAQVGVQPPAAKGVHMVVADALEVTVSDKSWMSEPAAVEPLAYYRLRFESQADGPGYTAAAFFDADGAALPDCNEAVYPSADWLEHAYCYRAHVDARTAAIEFTPQQQDLQVRQVRVEPVERAAVAAWADAIAADVPAITFAPSPERLQLLQAARRMLAEAGTLRVVILGDSIANDLSNSALDVLLEREHPGSRVELVNAVRGSTGCWFYQQEGNVEKYVLRYQPDLLIIAGISHHYDAGAIQSVIERVQASCDAEILVLSGAMVEEQGLRNGVIARSNLPPDEAAAEANAFTERLAALQQSHGVAFLDLHAIWEDYLAASDRPRAWFLRDAIHANQRGKQVMGRILLRYLRSAEDE